MKLIQMFAGLLLITLLLAACQPAAGTEQSAAGAATPTGYPAPGEAGAEGTTGSEGYPVQPGAALNNAEPLISGYPVLPGDENMAPGTFFLQTAELRANPNNSAQTDLFVTGSLPTPCNEIRAFVNPPDENKQVTVKVYSVADPEKICTQVLQPFEGVVTTFTDIPAGAYTVIVNETPLGELTVP